MGPHRMLGEPIIPGCNTMKNLRSVLPLLLVVMLVALLFIPGLASASVNATFSRSSSAFYSNGTWVSPSTGRFDTIVGQPGLLIEEGITNYWPANVANGGEDGTTTGFATLNGARVSSDTSQYYNGTHSIKVITCATLANSQAYVTRSVSSNAVYTISLYLKGTSGSEAVSMIASDNAGLLTTRNVTLTTGWQRYSFNFTTNAGAGTLTFKLGSANATGMTFYADSLQIENSWATTTWYQGGSVRAADVLTIPTAGVINPNNCTISQWLYVDNNTKDTHVSRDLF